MKKILAVFLSVTIAFSALMCYGLNAVAAGTTKKAVLKVENCGNRDIVDFDITTSKIPGSNPKCGIVTIKVQAPKDGNTQLLQWAFNSDDTRNVEIVVTESLRDNMEVKKIVLKGAECVHFEESYETTANGIVHCESISIICSEIVNSNIPLQTK